MVKCMEKNPDITHPSYNEHICASPLALCYIEIPLYFVPFPRFFFQIQYYTIKHESEVISR